MKKVIVIIVLGLLLFIESTEAAKRTSFKKGMILEGEVFWTQKIKVNLPAGQWQVIDKWSWQVNSVNGRGVSLEKLNGNVLDEVIEFEEVSQAWLFESNSIKPPLELIGLDHEVPLLYEMTTLLL